jgi:NADH dehydrogenase FAD-containing subunit
MTVMVATIVIVGGGQAGAQAVDTLRREGFNGRLVLISDEGMLPYQRPPLSKKFLSGEMAAERLLFRHRGFYDEHHVSSNSAFAQPASKPPRAAWRYRMARKSITTVSCCAAVLCRGA